MKSRKEKIIDYFDHFAQEYNQYRKRHAYYWNDSVRFFNYFLNGHESILQVGCGTGQILHNLKGKRKVGVDFSNQMIQEASLAFPDCQFVNQDAENLKLNETFDIIIFSNSIGYFDNVLDVFHQIRKLCHPKTKIFIQYYSRLWQPMIKTAEFIGYKKKGPEQNWLSSQDINNLLYLAGYEEYRQNMRMILPVNIPLLSTFLNRFLSRLPFFNVLCLGQYSFSRVMDFSTNKSEELSVSVVIPARNESGNIENAIQRIPAMGKWTELIFVEGNSTDQTWQTVQAMAEKYKNSHRIKIMQQDGKGKYDAVKKGFDCADGDILMILDADLTVPPEDLPKFFEAISSGKGEFINGSRLVYPMEDKAMRFLNIIGNKFFSYAFSWLLEQPIKDTLCGTKVLFRSDYIRLKENRKFFGDFDPFGDFDLLFGAYKLNLKIIDLPIRYRERTYGDTNISRFYHGFILLKMVLFALTRLKFI